MPWITVNSEPPKPPTFEDLGYVQVVRCKDCKHRPTYPEAYGAEIDGKWCYWCELHRAWKPDDWFCADGERR